MTLWEVAFSHPARSQQGHGRRFGMKILQSGKEGWHAGHAEADHFDGGVALGGAYGAVWNGAIADFAELRPVAVIVVGKSGGGALDGTVIVAEIAPVASAWICATRVA